MLETVAPEASYVKISGQIFQNHDFQVGGKCESILAMESWDLWSVWEVSGASLEVSWKSLGSIWEVSGRILWGGGASGGFWEVLGSKSGATLSEVAKKFPRGPTLPCVYEGQSHFMLQISMQNAPRQRKHMVKLYI